MKLSMHIQGRLDHDKPQQWLGCSRCCCTHSPFCAKAPRTICCTVATRPAPAKPSACCTCMHHNNSSLQQPVLHPSGSEQAAGQHRSQLNFRARLHGRIPALHLVDQCAPLPPRPSNRPPLPPLPPGKPPPARRVSTPALRCTSASFFRCSSTYKSTEGCEQAARDQAGRAGKYD
jgi:hypothetical protein